MMILIWIFTAFASPFSDKTMKGELTLLPMHRDLLLPKGRMSLGFDVASKNIIGYRDGNGNIVEYQNTNFLYNTSTLHYANGFSNSITMYATMPFVWQYLQKTDFQKPIQTRALGDVRTGIRYSIHHTDVRQYALTAELKSPSGVEWPSSYSGYPNDIQGFLTGTGTTNLGIGSQMRWNVSPKYTMDVDLGYIQKFRAVVGYVIEKDGFGNGRIKPGNEIFVQWKHRFALRDHIEIDGWGAYSYRSTYLYGTSGEGVLWNNKQELMAPTSYADAGLSFFYSPSIHHTWLISLQQQIWGSGTELFSLLGLEEFSPQPGMVYSFQYEVRW